MKYLFLFLLLFSNITQADECLSMQTSFEREEKAYDTVARIAIAGNSAYKIIGLFIKETEQLLTQCPKTYSLDRQYTLKRKLSKAKQYQASYRVFSQQQLSSYARSHPEEIIVYKWGTIRPVQ